MDMFSWSLFWVNTVIFTVLGLGFLKFYIANKMIGSAIMALFLFAFIQDYHLPKSKFKIYPIERISVTAISYEDGVASITSPQMGEFKVRLKRKDYLSIKSNLGKSFLYSYVPYIAFNRFRIEDDDVFMGEDLWQLYYK